MESPLSVLEHQTLLSILHADTVYYKVPTTRKDKSHKNVVAVGKEIQHLNVEVVDGLRFKGYVAIVLKNPDGHVFLGLSSLGKLFLKEYHEPSVLRG